MSQQSKLKAIFELLLSEIDSNEPLRQRLIRILEGSEDQATTKKSGRRRPGRLDVMEVYRTNPDDLSRQLDELSIEELKDIIAENGMDRAKLAMKWKSKDRLIDLILNVVQSRTQKGDAFRSD